MSENRTSDQTLEIVWQNGNLRIIAQDSAQVCQFSDCWDEQGNPHWKPADATMSQYIKHQRWCTPTSEIVAPRLDFTVLWNDSAHRMVLFSDGTLQPEAAVHESAEAQVFWRLASQSLGPSISTLTILSIASQLERLQEETAQLRARANHFEQESGRLEAVRMAALRHCAVAV